MDYERITADQVQAGDWITRTRNSAAQQVTFLSPGPRSIWIQFRDGGRIRPRRDAKLWRVTDWMID